ncbi:winged helix-turn-helix domain-containing protein [Obesumbacterium proteus]|uniref:winged helix-turn-helix domain-containing protein n=1 Tax=Obesumbacterium proteus TaxID=82983 RepID=UPI0024305385|nr:helix-turn-helix domain-containing protein [Obesumbacterium proteus]
MNGNNYLLSGNIFFNYKECYLLSISGSERVYIGSNPSELLLYLIKHHGNTATMDDINKHFFEKGRVVNAATATQYISKLRKVFRTLDNKSDIITTIKGGGYHIPSDIEVVKKSASSKLLDDDREMNNDLDTSNVCLSKKNYFSKFRYILFAVMLPIFIFVVFFLYFNDGLYFSPVKDVNYRFEFTKNECFFYVDRDPIEKNLDQNESFSKDIMTYCKKYPYVYVTYFDYSNNYSLIFCKTPAKLGEDITVCSSVLRLNND